MGEKEQWLLILVSKKRVASFMGKCSTASLLGKWLASRVGSPSLVPGPEGEKIVADEDGVGGKHSRGDDGAEKE